MRVVRIEEKGYYDIMIIRKKELRKKERDHRPQTTVARGTVDYS